MKQEHQSIVTLVSTTMKLLFVLFLAVAAVKALPYEYPPQFAMVPDESGWKLVNINEDPEPENFFTPENDIVFTLFTNENRDGHRIHWNDDSWIAGSGFNPSLPTRITIHGWNGGPTSGVNTAVRESLFNTGRFNVIQVDWSAGAGTVNYVSARNRVGPTGVVVANLLRLISAQTGADYRLMSVIGHSLGAHVAGFVGKNLNRQLGSIVALDAAFPLFSINNPDARVDSNDAHYVQSIHTNAGGLGFDEPIGHGNFYPNGGRSQPGCGLDVSGNCAHGRSHMFFAESITTDAGFWSRQCRNYQDITNNNCVSSGPDVLMGGELLNTNARGVYWLATNNAAPFAQGRLQ